MFLLSLTLSEMSMASEASVCPLICGEYQLLIMEAPVV